MKVLLALGWILMCAVPVAAFTYFDYSDEAEGELKALCSELRMCRAQLVKWDQVAAQAAKAEEMPYFAYERIFTYLYVAQSDAAQLACATKGAFVGSLDPVSERVLALFLPELCPPRVFCSDPFSEKLADIIVAKVKACIAEEKKRSPAWKCPEEYTNVYTAGLNIAKWEPWIINDPEDFWPAPPPASDDPAWQDEVCQIKRLQSTVTPTKRKTIAWWAGMCGFGSGEWRAIANQYLFSHRYTFQQTVRVRAILNIGLYDGLIACLGAKYHYMVDRPKVRDPSVCYIIPSPAHPSYPSGHSFEAGVAETILSALLPEGECRWRQLAWQSGISRIWAGIHYPIDDKAGQESGKRLAEAILTAVD